MKNYRISIGGLGAIGLAVARCIDAGEIPGLTLAAVSVRDHEKATRNMQGFRSTPPIVPLTELGKIESGRTFMPLSVGALLDHPQLIARARETGAVIFVPTGALLGLDAVKAVAEGTVNSITLVTRKPPNGLRGAPHLIDNNISIDNLQLALKVFSGNAREAAKAFPANVNVAAALALAGIGPERTNVQVWADPAVTRNTHTIEVDAEASSFSMTIQNVPSETPATGKITALSVIAALRRFSSPLVVGT